MKSIINLLIVISLLTAFPANVFAEFPNISKAIETRLYKGTTEDIISFGEKQQTQIEQLLSEAENLLGQTVNQSEKEEIQDTINIFKGIKFQFQRLGSELKKTSDLTVKAPQLGAAPYSISVFKSIRLFQREVQQQLDKYTKEVDLQNNKLTAIKNNLESLLFSYAGMKKENSAEKGMIYKTLAEFYSLQLEYSLLKLRLSKIPYKIDSLHKLRDDGKKLIKICLENIRITEDNLLKAKRRLDDFNLQKNSASEKLQKEKNILNNKRLRYELDLGNIVDRLNSYREDITVQYFLELEKKRFEAIIETIQIKNSSLDQKMLNLKVNTLDASYQYYWLNWYHRSNRDVKILETMQMWQDKLTYLQETGTSLTETIAQAGTKKLQLTQQISIISDKIKLSSEQKIKDSLSALLRQISKTKEMTDELITSAVDTQKNIIFLSSEIRWFLDFLLGEMSWHEKYRDSFEKTWIKSWNNIKSVLFYPLFVVGETSITLASIFKLIILLIAGVVILRLIRRKTATVLYEKTKLSTGSVSSITTLGYYIFLVISVFIILTAVGIDLTQLTVLVGALGVGIGFGMQTIANNFISGIILLVEQSIKSGDIVMLEGGLTGEVKKVAIRATIIRTFNGDDIIVPNSEFVSGRVNSWTYSDDWRRLNIPFGVSYNSDPDEIVKLATEAAREVEITVEDRDHPIRVFFEGYGESSLDFSIRVWCRMTRLRIRSGLVSDYYFVLFRKLKEAGVIIPFPQRDLHIQSVSPEFSTIFKEKSEENKEK
ncbi:MAG: mechanosensitive ion channel [Deltaproteobacteria bacterium]|nr:mechanosensitive ion channel [Deltaproteobacteria bacterium]MBW2663367.1 mechanosensitive ion channel [Deltaproteobacteria bacterium]